MYFKKYFCIFSWTGNTDLFNNSRWRKKRTYENISVCGIIYINKSDFCINMDNFLKLPI